MNRAFTQGCGEEPHQAGAFKANKEAKNPFLGFKLSFSYGWDYANPKHGEDLTNALCDSTGSRTLNMLMWIKEIERRGLPQAAFSYHYLSSLANKKLILIKCLLLFGLVLALGASGHLDCQLHVFKMIWM